MRNIYITIAIILFWSCGSTPKKTSATKNPTDSTEFYTFDLENVITDGVSDSVSTFVINDIAKNIRFIPLETSPQTSHNQFRITLLKNKDSYIVSDMIPYSLAKYDTMGRFVKNLARVGRGPAEITLRWGAFSNDSLDQLCVIGSRKIVANSFNGEYLYNIIFDENIADVHEIALLNSTDLVCTPIGYQATGATDSPYLFFMNDNGKIIHSLYYDDKRDIKQRSMTESNQDSRIRYENNSLTSNYLNEALFRDVFNDTIYKIKDTESIIPYINLHRGELMPTSKDVDDLADNRKKIYCMNMAETEDYFIMKYFYDIDIFTAIWDKKSGNIIANIGIDYDLKTIEEESDYYYEVMYKMTTRYRTPQKTEIIVNIVLATKDKLYCLVEAEKAMTFMPDVKEEYNFVLMIVDLK